MTLHVWYFHFFFASCDIGIFLLCIMYYGVQQPRFKIYQKGLYSWGLFIHVLHTDTYMYLICGLFLEY